MLTVLVHISLLAHGYWCLKLEDGHALHSGALSLPWLDVLCCESPSTYLDEERGDTNTTDLKTTQPTCRFKKMTAESQQFPNSPKDTCLDILCQINKNWTKVDCHLRLQNRTLAAEASDQTTLRLRWLPEKSLSQTADNPVVCEAEESLTCSLPLKPAARLVAMVTTVSNVTAPPVLFTFPARPVKPSPPVNLTHFQTIKAELIVHWTNPSGFDDTELKYELRYSSKSHPTWQILEVEGKSRVSLILLPYKDYTFQVRCSSLDQAAAWSDWSQPHNFILETVTYIPESMVAQAGDNVTVYCVFNDRSMAASEAVWKLNYHPLDVSTYSAISQWVSKVTVHTSDTLMYDVLTCTPGEDDTPYSQISLKGAFLNIKCKTNGDIDAMECSWNKTQWLSYNLQHKWTYASCETMKAREEAGEDIGKTGKACNSIASQTCTISPLPSGCYKLWLELGSASDSVRSKPIYLSSNDQVKPHSPNDVKAETLSSGVLRVSWKSPPLPVDGFQYEMRYHVLSSVKEEWKNESTAMAPSLEVKVPEMCRIYVVQVRCKHISGSGYWSEWSDTVYSTPVNNRVPKHGPDFWRIREDGQPGDKSSVTLLFEPFPVSWESYCVDGFIVQHQTLSGLVVRKQINLGSSYTFEWNQDRQTVSVEAYNSLGNSTNNVNMTLEKKPTYEVLDSFSAVVVNSSCASLSWSLLDTSLAPSFMVVEWSESPDKSAKKWSRLTYSDQAVFLKGNFSYFEDYTFRVYPVFANGEGEPLSITVTRRNGAAYTIMMFTSIICIILFLTLLFTQNQIKKRFVWQRVPNPKKCSWANGLDFKRAEAFENLFPPGEGTQTCPLLLPSNNIISQVIIVENSRTKMLMHTQNSSLAVNSLSSSGVDFTPVIDPVDEALFTGACLNATNTYSQQLNESESTHIPAEQQPEKANHSSHSSVIYADLLLPDEIKKKQPAFVSKDCSGGTFSDEGNFSANNSDISGSSPAALWELDSCHSAESMDSRRSCSYNSEGELSDISEQDVDREGGQMKRLCYIEVDYTAQNENGEEIEPTKEEETNSKEPCDVFHKNGCLVEATSVLSMHGLSSVYMPQYRTAEGTRELTY